MTTKQLTNIFSLEGKTAVVLGGTSGTGRTLRLGLADAGADVVASARRQEQVDATAAEIERRGRRTVRLRRMSATAIRLNNYSRPQSSASAKSTCLLTAPNKPQQWTPGSQRVTALERL